LREHEGQGETNCQSQSSQLHSATHYQTKDFRRTRSKRDTHADLSCPLPNRVRDNTVDSQGGQQEGGSRKKGKQNQAEACIGKRVADQLIHAANVGNRKCWVKIGDDCPYGWGHAQRIAICFDGKRNRIGPPFEFALRQRSIDFGLSRLVQASIFDVRHDSDDGATRGIGRFRTLLWQEFFRRFHDDRFSKGIFVGEELAGQRFLMIVTLCELRVS